MSQEPRVSIFEAIGAFQNIAQEIETSEGYEDCKILGRYLYQQKDKTIKE